METFNGYDDWKCDDGESNTCPECGEYKRGLNCKKCNPGNERED